VFPGEKSFSGLWRGVVIDNDDRKTTTPCRGKLQVFVPQVYGRELPQEDFPWAEPCFPLYGGGRNNGESSGLIGLPAIGSSVWIMFEQGSPQNPVWMGTWFGAKDVEQDDPYEMGSESTEKYPNVFVIKPPFTASFIRMDQNSVEIQLSDGIFIKMDKEGDVVINGGEKTISILSEGNIDISGKNVNISGESISVDAKEILDAYSEGISEYGAKGINTFSSRSGIRGRASSASGFEDH